MCMRSVYEVSSQFLSSSRITAGLAASSDAGQAKTIHRLYAQMSGRATLTKLSHLEIPQTVKSERALKLFLKGAVT